MRPTLYQGQRSHDDYTVQLAMLHERNRQRLRQAYEKRQAMSQPSSPVSDTPITAMSWQAPRSDPWCGQNSGPPQFDPSLTDAIKQYQRMLLEEQTRRNQEMRKSSPF